MIIKCINCNKKFEVNTSLIPDTGRNLQCGSCNYNWFYKTIDDTTSAKVQDFNKEENNENPDKIKENQIKLDPVEKINEEILIDKQELFKNDEIIKPPKIKKSTNFKLSRLLSFILVCIISFVALIIILDTFKSPLSNIFPELELLLYNLFETIKDIFLFIKNLLV